MLKFSKRTVTLGVEGTFSLYKATKRFAGHSKWANIKHVKAQKDGERATLFAKITRQMRVAIAEEGSGKPSDNPRLAQIIEVAKKKNMPLATIKNVLDKAEKTPDVTQTSIIEARGPGGCILIVEFMSTNIKATKMSLNYVFKKNGAVGIDQSGRNVFHHKGFVVTEKKGNLDEATEDAIEIGAEEVEEINHEGVECYQFTCDAKNLAKTANLLTARKYTILLREDKFIPHIFANLTDSEVDRAAILYAKLEALDEVTRIHDNIA